MSDLSSSAFRASDWIEYAPDKHRSARPLSMAMDNDVDMDAPQISTLKDEASPPPQQTAPPPTPAPAPPTQGGRVSKFRVKLKVTEPSARASSHAPALPPARQSAGTVRGASAKSRAHGPGEDSQEEGTQDSQDSEEEWDQLADDDDIAPPSSSVIGTPARLSHHTSTLGTSVRGGRGAGRGKGRGRGRGRGGTAVSAAEPPQTIFEIAPSVAHPELGAPGMLDTGSAGTGSPSPSKPKRRTRNSKPDAEKKKPGRKPRASKVMQLQDDAASIASESFVGTASSSPFVRGGEFSTPELEPVPLNVNLPPSSVTFLPLGVSDKSTSQEPSQAPDIAVPVQQQQQQQSVLDPSVPIPVYRLPSRPFLVQPPPKIPSGFAPAIPLDRGPAARAPVRRWRPALRAIRGIAGGQWFAKTWVGEKESVYASVVGRDRAGSENAPPYTNPAAHGHGHGHGTGKGRGSTSASPAPSVGKLPPAPALSALSGVSVGSTRTPGRSKLSQGGAAAGTASTSDSSRAGSMPAEGNININTGKFSPTPVELLTHAHPTGMRPLSKMRHTVSAEDTEMIVDDTA